jgi:RNA polymerase sigma factor for flagellar operon FliA
MQKDELNSTWKNFLQSRSEESKKKLVEHYYIYVERISNSVAQSINWKVKPEELASHGVDGLYKAIEGFNEKLGNKFETYAYTRIRGAMIDGLRTEDWVPRSVRQRQDKIEGIKTKLEIELGRKPTDKEVLKKLGISEKDFFKHPNKYKAASQSSIEQCVGIDVCVEYKKDFNKYLICKNTSNPNGKMIRREFFKSLISGGDFSTLEKKIVYLKYYEDFTFKEIAQKLDISESRTSQLNKKILNKLKKKIENDEYFDKSILEFINEGNHNGSIFS